jgi:hypothetical protein
MNYTVHLDTAELDKLAAYLDNYADTFQHKVQMFLLRLADLAIDVAQVNEGVFAGYIIYSKKFEGKNSLYMMAKDRQSITNKWYGSASSEEEREEVISPILMAEFGSGHYAIKGKGGIGGQGTLNKYGHAFDTNGWYWWTDNPSSLDGTLKAVKEGRFKFHSDGVAPAQPLHKAVMACIKQVEGIAHEVFG